MLRCSINRPRLGRKPPQHVAHDQTMRRGYSDGDLTKLAGQNLLRAMRAVEQVARELQART